MRKWLPGVLIAITFVLSVLMLPQLPAAVTLEMSPLLPFDVEGESAPRAWFAFGIPTVAAVLWFFFLFATSRPGLVVQKRAFGGWAPAEALDPQSIARFRPTYDVVVALVI